VIRWTETETEIETRIWRNAGFEPVGDRRTPRR
jgi:hypothetical protein